MCPGYLAHCGYLSLTYGDALLDGGAIAHSSIVPCSDSEGVRLTSPLHCLVDQNVSDIGVVHLHMQDIFDGLSHIMISTYYKAYGEVVKYVLQCFSRPICICIKNVIKVPPFTIVYKTQIDTCKTDV